MGKLKLTLLIMSVSTGIISILEPMLIMDPNLALLTIAVSIFIIVLII